MVAVMYRVSASVVDDCIAAWRRARLSCDQGKLDYPAINILHAAYYPAGESDHEPFDDPAADMVQEVVDEMPEDVRASFEAYWLGRIRDEWCRDKPHKWRWLVLGIDEARYYARIAQGWNLVREGVEAA